MTTLFIAFVIAVSASGELRSASWFVDTEALCEHYVVETVANAQARGVEVVKAGCYPVEVDF